MAILPKYIQQPESLFSPEGERSQFFILNKCFRKPYFPYRGNHPSQAILFCEYN